MRQKLEQIDGRKSLEGARGHKNLLVGVQNYKVLLEGAEDKLPLQEVEGEHLVEEAADKAVSREEVLP